MRALAFVAFAVLSCLASRGFGAETLEERAKRDAELQGRFADSVVQARYYVRLGPNGESPDFLGWRDRVNDYLDKGFPIRYVGFAIAPDRVLLKDPLIRPKWIDRIEVAFGGAFVEATEAVRYPAEHALELRLAKPLAGICPLAFAATGAPEKPAFFGAWFEPGRMLTGLKGGVDFRRCVGDGTRDVVQVPTETIAVNASNEAVTVVFRGRRERDLAAVFRPPSAWRGEPADVLEREAAAQDARFGGCVAGVYLRLDTKPKEQSGRYGTSYVVFDDSEASWEGNQKGDERDLIGLVLEGGEVLVPAKLSSEETARIRKIELLAPDGKRHELDFCGALGDWAAFVARFKDGAMPPGLSACRFHPGGTDALRDADGWNVRLFNESGRIRVDSRAVRFGRFAQVRGGEFVPDDEGDRYDRAGTGLLADREGRVVSMRLIRRNSVERYASGEELVGGRMLAELVASHDFNPEFMPRVDTDRVRAAWIGVDVQSLTEDVAREKKATSFLQAAHSRGALVGKVYADTPADKAGIREGDVLVDMRIGKSRSKIALEADRGYGGGGFSFEMLSGNFTVLDGTRGMMPWPNVERGINETFSRFGIGTKAVVSFVSDGARKEAEVTLAQVPEHFLSARRSRNRDIGMTVSDLTFEVRDYYRMAADAPGVVITKLKSGDPAAVAGLRAFEIITEVNGEAVKDARDFGRRIKGARQMTFSVRRLTATRIVRIDLGKKE